VPWNQLAQTTAAAIRNLIVRTPAVIVNHAGTKEAPENMLELVSHFVTVKHHPANHV